MYGISKSGNSHPYYLSVLLIFSINNRMQLYFAPKKLQTKFIKTPYKSGAIFQKIFSRLRFVSIIYIKKFTVKFTLSR
ncbi:hypothetical protein DRQ29_01130 [bacterium]|nr:MAG: hypothetical protein DRQ29_01130 [bacterium]